MQIKASVKTYESWENSFLWNEKKWTKFHQKDEQSNIFQYEMTKIIMAQFHYFEAEDVFANDASQSYMHRERNSSDSICNTNEKAIKIQDILISVNGPLFIHRNGWIARGSKTEKSVNRFGGLKGAYTKVNNIFHTRPHKQHFYPA